MTAAAGVEFESYCRWGNDRLVRREKSLRVSSFNEAEFDEVLNVAFNVHPIVGVGERNEFPGRASEQTNRKQPFPSTDLAAIWQETAKMRA